MAKLSARNGNDSWPLNQQPLTIGRRPDNPIVISDSFASGRHAMIGWDGAQYYVEDLNSSNGTLLNEQPVSRATLRSGDVIRIGTRELLFEDDAPELATQVLSRPLRPEPPNSAAAAPATSIRPEPAAVGVTPAAQPQATPPTAAAASLLDELVGSIRSHRDREQQELQALEARIKAEWDKTLALAEELKAKTAGDARVKRFIVDRRAQDVMIQLHRGNAAPMLFLTLSLRHPDNPSGTLRGIWLRRTGEADRCLDSAQAVGTELIRDLAFLLA